MPHRSWSQARSGDGSPICVGRPTGWVPGNDGHWYLVVMKKRGPAEFPGRLTGEVILFSDHYDLNEKAEQHRREKEPQHLANEASKSKRRRWQFRPRRIEPSPGHKVSSPGAGEGMATPDQPPHPPPPGPGSVGTGV